MKTLLSWSTGKDSAWCLHVLRETPGIEVAELFTVASTPFDRAAMHGVRRKIIDAQASAAGLPLTVLEIPHPCPNETYEQVMGAFVEEARQEGVEAVAFGDLFLEDIRRYREERLQGTGLTPLFPLWERETSALARDMIDGGLAATLVCIDPKKLDRSFAGRSYDHAFLADLPDGIDPCGENGEFHTCVTGGPMFRAPIAVTPGETVERDGFIFTDLMLD